MYSVNSPIFLQSAGNSTRFEGIKMMFLSDDPTIQSITGTGDITIRSTKNGEEVIDTITDPEGDAVAVQADKNTWIYIEGEVTELEHTDETKLVRLTATNTALTILNCYSCYALQELNLSTNTALTILNCYSCYALQELNLSTNTALTSLNCSDCYALQELNLSTNTALTSLDCNSITQITAISYPATNSDVATAIANAITNADSSDGIVYTDSDADYYSTIETAANDKGWTIAPIAA